MWRMSEQHDKIGDHGTKRIDACEIVVDLDFGKLFGQPEGCYFRKDG